MTWPKGKVPQHIVQMHGTSRAWKRLKRKEVKAVLRAMEDLRLGSAYLPCGLKPVYAAIKALREIEQSVTEKSWGR